MSTHNIMKSNSAAQIPRARAKAMHQASYPASRRSHFDLVPGNQNTTTKEPTVRPPDIRLVTSLASKGPTLSAAMRKMNMGPSGRETMLQQVRALTHL